MTARRRLAGICRSVLPDRAGGRQDASHEEGATVVEFAIVAPVMIMLLITTFDIGQMAFANAVLRGVVQDAARSSSLETGDTTAADNKVKAAVGRVLPGAAVVTGRLSYFDFDDIGRPELWDDKNNDGACNNGETYTDENANGSWDADVGRGGNGSASDVVVYSVTVTYQPIFKIPDFWNKQTIRDSWGSRELTAKAIRKNQPFAKQNNLGSTTASCT